MRSYPPNEEEEGGHGRAARGWQEDERTEVRRVRWNIFSRLGIGRTRTRGATRRRRRREGESSGVTGFPGKETQRREAILSLSFSTMEIGSTIACFFLLPSCTIRQDTCFSHGPEDPSKRLGETIHLLHRSTCVKKKRDRRKQKKTEKTERSKKKRDEGKRKSRKKKERKKEREKKEKKKKGKRTNVIEEINVREKERESEREGKRERREREGEKQR